MSCGSSYDLSYFFTLYDLLRVVLIGLFYLYSIILCDSYNQTSFEGSFLLSMRILLAAKEENCYYLSPILLL